MKHAFGLIILFMYCGAGFGMEYWALSDSDDEYLCRQEKPLLENSDQSSDAQISLKVSKKKKKELSFHDQLKMIKTTEYDNFKQLISNKKLDKATSGQLYKELKLEHLNMEDLKKTIYDPSTFLASTGLTNHEKIYEDMINITTLYLGHNTLKDLPDELKELKLKVLDISHNEFEEFPKVIGMFCKTLEMFAAAHNKITRLDELGNKKISTFKKLIELDLRDNKIKKIDCTCELAKRYKQSNSMFKIKLGHDDKDTKYYKVDKQVGVDIMNKVCAGNVRFVLKQPSEPINPEQI